MDFAKLDLKAASEQGSWVHLEYDGERLFHDGKPCRVHIRGMAAPEVLSAMRALTRIETLMEDRLRRTSDKDADTVLKGFEGKIEDATAELIVAAADKWENIQWDGKAFEFNRENLLKLCGPTTLFFGQVRDAIMEHKRLFTKPATA